MKANNSGCSGFTIAEVVILMLVFCAVALGIFLFFTSQREDIRLKATLAQVNRAGQSLSEAFKGEIADLDGWVAADATEMRFISHGEEVAYNWDMFTDILSRNGVEIAHNVEGADFHYYAARAKGNESELPRPVPNCPPGAEAKDCVATLNNIREVEVRFVVGSEESENAPGSQKGSLAPDNTLFSKPESHAHIKRQFVVRIIIKNISEATNEASQINACGRVTLTPLGGAEIASCDADGDTSIIKVTTMAPDAAGVMSPTDKNAVKIGAVYRYDTDPAPASRRNTAAGAPDDYNGDPPEAPAIDHTEVNSAMRASGGSGSVGITLPADQAGNKIVVFAQWTPPASPACPRPPLLNSNRVVITVKAGVPASLRASGEAARSPVTLGADSAAALNTCKNLAGCRNTATTLRVQLLDKCGNPVSNAENKVKFSISLTDPEGRFGSLSGFDPFDKTLIVSPVENGIYETSVFSGPNMPTGAFLPVRAELLGNPGIAADVAIPLKTCDVPYKLDLLSPASGTLPAEGVIPACPGRSEIISFRVLNACGDPITLSENPAISPSNPANWTISMASGQSEGEDAHKIGNLGPIVAGKVAPVLSGNSFLITYNTGGTGLDVSQLDSSYCGTARAGAPINLKFNPLPETTGKKTVLVNLGACPILSVQLSLDNRLSIPQCADSSGSQSICMRPGCPGGGDHGEEFVLRARIFSCPAKGANEVPLKNAGVLFVAENPKNQFLHPQFIGGDGHRSFMTTLPADYRSGRADATAQMSYGNLSVANALNDKITVRALLCFPGANGALDTPPGSLTCKGDDMEISSNPLYFMVGMSPAGFINKLSAGETFAEGKIGVYSSGTYDYRDQLLDVNEPYSFPYGTPVSAPQHGVDSKVFFEVRDCDQNRDATAADSLTLTLTSALTRPNDTLNVILKETGPNTGVFRGGATLTRFTGINQPGKLGSAPGDLITFKYQDPSDPNDVIIGRLYTSGCRGMHLRNADGKPVSAVIPSLFGKNISLKNPRHLFGVEAIMPEKAYYAGNEPAGESEIFSICETGPSRPYIFNRANCRDLALKESDVSGSQNNNGIFRFGDLYSARVYDFEGNGGESCDDNGHCVPIGNTPGRIEFKSKVGDCRAVLSVKDVDPPRIMLKKVLKGAPDGPVLQSGGRVTGMVYLEGEAYDTGGVTEIAASVDGGLTYIFNGGYDSATGKWGLDIDAGELPDGLYRLRVRARDSAGNEGYSSAEGVLQAFSFIVDKYSEPITLLGASGAVCGKHEFVADVSGFKSSGGAGPVVNFYMDGAAKPVAHADMGQYGLARATIDLSGFSGGPPGHVIRAVASDDNDPAVTAGASQDFILDDSPPSVSLSIPAYDGMNPLSGVVGARVVTHSCVGVKEVSVESYLVSNMTVRSAPVAATFLRCLTSPEADGACRDAEWAAYLDTNPTSCIWSDGFTGDGQNAFHATAVDYSGRTGTTVSERAYPVDNPPTIKLRLPENYAVSGAIVFEVEVADCDGVAKDNVTMSVPGMGTFNITRKSGPDRDAVYSLTLNTSDYPACRYGISYFPDGVYSYQIIADDGSPMGACAAPETAGTPNRCGVLKGAFRIENRPTGVAITSINGAPPVDGREIMGNSLSVDGTAESCGLKAGSGAVRLLIDGMNVGDMIPGPGGKYSIKLNKKPSLSGGAHTLVIEAIDWTGASVQSAPRKILRLERE